MLGIVAALINLPYKKLFMWLYTDQAQNRQSNISLGRKAWKHVIALLKGALICGVKTILYVTWEKFAIQFLLVKSVFFDLTSHSSTWDYRSGISPAGPEKWLGPGIYRQERLVSLRGKKWNQRLYLVKVLMNKTSCRERKQSHSCRSGCGWFPQGAYVSYINWACTHLLELDWSAQCEHQEDTATITNRQSLF